MVIDKYLKPNIETPAISAVIHILLINLQIYKRKRNFKKKIQTKEKNKNRKKKQINIISSINSI